LVENSEKTYPYTILKSIGKNKKKATPSYFLIVVYILLQLYKKEKKDS